MAAQKKKTGKKAAPPPQKQARPVRREVGGFVCLLLALCVLVSYFGVQAFFLTLLEKLLKGLTGYGYWLWAAAARGGGRRARRPRRAPGVPARDGDARDPRAEREPAAPAAVPCGVCTGRDRTARLCATCGSTGCRCAAAARSPADLRRS